MLAYVGYDRYFDFEEYVDVMNFRVHGIHILCKDKKAIKEDLVRNVPHVAFNRHVWWKEDDLVAYMSKELPKHPIAMTFHRYKVEESIYRYWTEYQMLNYYLELQDTLMKSVRGLADPTLSEEQQAELWFNKESLERKIELIDRYLPGYYAYRKSRYGLVYGRLSSYEEMKNEIAELARMQCKLEGKYNDETVDILKDFPRKEKERIARLREEHRRRMEENERRVAE